MRRLGLRLVWLLGLTLPLQAAAEARLESWSLAAMHAEEEADLSQELADLRGALAIELSGRGKGVLRDPGWSQLRLGLPDADLRTVSARIDAAELYYFQLELELARSNLEQALDELGHAAGIPEAWERTRVARMLLAMVHLARRTPDSRTRALEQLIRVARIQPGWSPSLASYPAEVNELYAEAQRRLEARGKGRLRVGCEPACPGGQVYVDSYPLAAPGEAIELPPGRYRVAVTDRFEDPRHRSLLREVEVTVGAESRVTVDLEREGKLLIRPGPVVIVPRDLRARRLAAEQVAQRLGTDRILILQLGEEGERLAWLLDGGGAILREIRSPPGADAPGRIARLATSEAIPGEGVPVAALAGGEGASVAALQDAVVPTVESGPVPAEANGFPTWRTATWSTAGAALLAGSVGLYLRLDADDREEALRADLAGRNGVYSSVELARRARAEAAAIRDQARWGNGLLWTAGILSATAVALYLLDLDAPEPAIRW